MFNYFGIKVGIHTEFGSCKKNKKRIRYMTNKSSFKGKRTRKALRSKKKGFTDNEKEREGGESYVSGGF